MTLKHRGLLIRFELLKYTLRSSIVVSRSEEVKLIVRSSFVSHSEVGILTPGGACCGELVPGLTVERYFRSECTDKAENVIEILSFICENHNKSVLSK